MGLLVMDRTVSLCLLAWMSAYPVWLRLCVGGKGQESCCVFDLAVNLAGLAVSMGGEELPRVMGSFKELDGVAAPDELDVLLQP